MLGSEKGCQTKLMTDVCSDIGKLFKQWNLFSRYRVTVYGDVNELLAEFGKALGLKINRKRIERLMHDNRIAAKTSRKFKVTTDSSHNLPVFENLVKQNFNPTAVNKLWASDITYIWTKEGWLYLAVIMDLFVRPIWPVLD